MKINLDVLKGAAIVLAALALLYAVLWVRGFERATRLGFQSVEQYIGACQQAGLLPSPQALQDRLAQIEAQQKAKEAEKK